MMVIWYQLLRGYCSNILIILNSLKLMKKCCIVVLRKILIDAIEGKRMLLDIFYPKLVYVGDDYVGYNYI